MNIIETMQAYNETKGFETLADSYVYILDYADKLDKTKGRSRDKEVVRRIFSRMKVGDYNTPRDIHAVLICLVLIHNNPDKSVAEINEMADYLVCPEYSGRLLFIVEGELNES